MQIYPHLDVGLKNLFALLIGICQVPMMWSSACSVALLIKVNVHMNHGGHCSHADSGSVDLGDSPFLISSQVKPMLLA